MTDFLLSAHPDPASIISTLPLYFQRWLAADDSDDEEDTYSPPSVGRHSVGGDTDYEYFALRHGLDSPSEFDYVSPAFHGSFATGWPLDPDQLIDDEGMDFASKYLNLDHDTSPLADHTVEAGASFPPAFSDSSASFAGTPGDVGMQWGFEPNSLSLLDATKFEIEVGADGVEMRSPWPWGNYTYRPFGRPRYIDPEEYIQKYELMKAEEKLRARLTELFAEEAVRAGKKPKVERRRERKESEAIEKETPMPIIAFSQVVRGRTIYNP